jgi:fumarate hydratase class II
MNEVLANRASEILGGPRGTGRLVHANDHVNKGQSSNDVFPTAMHVAAVGLLRGRVIPAIGALRNVLTAKSEELRSVVKLGRTHLQDATPITLGQEISGWAAQVAHGLDHLESALPHLHALAIGGTAVGTGMGAHPEFGSRVCTLLSAYTRETFTTAQNPFEALASHDAMVWAHGALRGIAAALTKIANDVRWLASGPRAGLGEITIPENEPGSSIMPGKVNPTQAEALLMACLQVIANDVAIGFAGASGNFELNVWKPLIAHSFLQSCRLLADGCDSFRAHCASGIEANLPRIKQNLESSLMLATALSPHIGYDAASRIAISAHREGKTLRQAAVDLGLVTPEDFDRWVRPEDMTGI